jgi:DNA-directed RNA polymerase specialized sigma subunit
MTAKEFLRLAWRIDGRIEHRIEERERLDARLKSGRLSNLSGMPRGGQYDWTNTADSVVEIDKRIGDEIAELCKIKRLVNEAIDAVDDVRYRQVLERRYRFYMSWDEIAEEMGYDPRHVQRLHGEALLCVVVPKEFA